jgi:hypothetical protein
MYLTELLSTLDFTGTGSLEASVVQGGFSLSSLVSPGGWGLSVCGVDVKLFIYCSARGD